MKSKVDIDKESSSKVTELADLTTIDILMMHFYGDRERANGILALAVRQLDDKSFKVLFNSVKDYVRLKLNLLENKNETKTIRRSRTVTADKATKHNTKRARAAGQLTRKAKVRNSTGTRTRKKK